MLLLRWAADDWRAIDLGSHSWTTDEFWHGWTITLTAPNAMRKPSACADRQIFSRSLIEVTLLRITEASDQSMLHVTRVLPPFVSLTNRPLQVIISIYNSGSRSFAKEEAAVPFHSVGFLFHYFPFYPSFPLFSF